MNKIKIPEYDGKESVNSYQRKLKKIMEDIKKIEYNKILEFINKLFNVGDKNALSLFSNIDADLLNNNIKLNKQLFLDYATYFYEEHDIDCKLKDNDENFIENSIIIINKILSIQDCKLILKEKKYIKEVKKVYSIITK